VRSVLDQADSRVSVIISDNSTSPQDVAILEAFCDSARDDRLCRIRPPDPLPMAGHWQWAVQQALERDANHFTYLTDRMVFKPGSLKVAIEVVKRHPDRMLCYLHDKVNDYRPPFSVHQYEWTGKLFEVSSARLLALSAQSVMYDGSCPRMLNCVVPRAVLEAIRRRHGTVFSSIAPDWNFAYRTLELVDSVLYLHKALLVHYALKLSNGESAHRGIKSVAYADFLKDLPVPMNVDAPFPEIVTVWNAIISEYCTVKKETGAAKLPELDMRKYIQALADGIGAIEDPAVRVEMERRLMRRGWIKPPPRSPARTLPSPRSVVHTLRSLAASLRRQRFGSADAALDFAVRTTRPRNSSVPWEEELLQAVEIPVPDDVADGLRPRCRSVK
jgi:hypothetical protein